MTNLRIPADLQAWIDARKRYRLSHAVVQMARELGMNPKKLGGLANTKQEPWKAPLPEFIADLYRRRFGKTATEPVMTIEEIARRKQEKKQLKRTAKAARKNQPDTDAVGSVTTKVESIEEEIENLSPSEFAEFRAWFLERDWTE
jgi:FMN-dependent NADH-azoreductase